MMQKKILKSSLFYLIMLVIPLLILLLLEILLRVAGYGMSYPLFVPSTAMQGYLKPNTEIINRYFINPEQAPNIKPDTYYFKKNKQPGSFRIIVQGGSTAAGFPFGRFASLAGMLQQRFKRIYPDRDIEIISTAFSAVNTYTMLDFVDEIIAVKPDLILIYTGHNEYLGIMGVGSSYASMGNRSATLMFLKLKELRLFQMMQHLLLVFSGDSTTSRVEQSDNGTLMAKIAKEKNIAIDSPIFIQGVEQFSGNLDLILAQYQKHNIPVMISTIASNEKHQPPFASTKNKGADYFYKLAQSLEQKGLIEQARENYFQARDLDLLRFRAPQIFNQVIREKASQQGIILVDGEQKLREESANDIIGNQLMYEHLHPNARGYFLLSEAFVKKIVSSKIISSTPRRVAATVPWDDIPISKVNQLIADFKIKTLLADYPFTLNKKTVEFAKAITFEQKMAKKQLGGSDWFVIQKNLLQHYQLTKKFRKAAKIAGLIFDAFPNQAQPAYVAGQLYFQLNDLKIALYYHRKAVILAPENINYLMSAAKTYYYNQRRNDALQMLEKVLELDPNHPQASFQLQRLQAESQ